MPCSKIYDDFFYFSLKPILPLIEAILGKNEQFIKESFVTKFDWNLTLQQIRYWKII